MEVLVSILGKGKKMAWENVKARSVPLLTVLIVADQAEIEVLAEKTRVAASVQ